jgi:hypothetical protein
MKNKFKISTLLVLALLALNISVAKADPTYAVLDTNGNVTNVIVCGSACEGGTFGGQTVVLQVAADPVTGENRGGVWQGLGTTRYSENKEFILTLNETFTSVIVENESTEDTETINTIGVTRDNYVFSFKYEDTIDKDTSKILKEIAPNENSQATIFVEQKTFLNNDKEEIETNTLYTESLIFNERKFESEIISSASNKNFNLILNKIQILISLLGSWVK